MIHAGIGFLTTITLPSISCNTLKQRERDFGPSIQLKAKQSCGQASIDKSNLTLNSDKFIPDHTLLKPDAEDGENNGKCEIIADDYIAFDEALHVLEAGGIHFFID